MTEEYKPESVTSVDPNSSSGRAMHEIDLRLMRAAVAVAEELNFSRAAARVHVSQPGLTKQIQDLEGFLGTKLFERDHKKVTVTDAGQVFVAEARMALSHHQRAIQAAKSTASGAEAILNVGQSPYTDPFLTSIISTVHLPLYPNLRLHTSGDYSPELSRRVAASELDLAVLEAGADVSQLSSVELSASPLYILLDRTSDLATRREFVLRDLEQVPWILFAPQAHPFLYEGIADRALKVGANPSEKQHVTSAEQAAQLVKSTGGVAFLTKSEAWRVSVNGLTLRPLSETGLTVRTVVVARNDAGRLVSEFMRAIVRKVRRITTPAQQKLRLAI
jgi:DNA-binding transcriptional LysR family regulator